MVSTEDSSINARSCSPVEEERERAKEADSESAIVSALKRSNCQRSLLSIAVKACDISTLGTKILTVTCSTSKTDAFEAGKRE
jgi:hypothetical protein